MTTTGCNSAVQLVTIVFEQDKASACDAKKKWLIAHAVSTQNMLSRRWMTRASAAIALRSLLSSDSHG